MSRFRRFWYTGFAYSQHAASYADSGAFQDAIRCSRIAIAYFRRADRELARLKSYRARRRYE